MKYLQEAILRSRQLTYVNDASPASVASKTPEEQRIADAIAKVNAKLGIVMVEAEDDNDPAMSDKGMFGGRQVRFKQNVWKIPSAPAGDVSQPIGLLTQSDLDNYVAFRKDDRLTLKYKDGSAGSCCYVAKRNGSDTEVSEYEWSDGLIQELIDEGALELL